MSARDEEIEELKARLAEHERLAAAHRRIYDALPVGIAVNGPDGRFIDVNSAGLRLFGMRLDEVVGRTALEVGLIQPNDHDHARIGDLVHEKGSVSTTARVIHSKSGELHDVALLVEVVALRAGPSYVSTFIDVTEQKRVVDQLAASEARYRQIVETTPSGVCITDVQGVITFANARSEAMLGYAPGEMVGASIFDVMDEPARAFAVEHLSHRPGGGDIRVGELELKRKDGAALWSRFYSSRVVDERGACVGSLGLIFDITQQRQTADANARLQSQLILADRMASVGTLAAGVAHEINNPLAYVISNLELIAEEIREIAGGSPSGLFRELSGLTDEARQGAERVRKIVRGLKTLSRADEDRRVLLDVRQVLDFSINMAFNELRHRARLVKDYREVPQIEADEARLGQVFINLLVNAGHAMPEGQAHRNEIRLSTDVDADGRVIVEVRDTGPGIPPEVLARVFDPFFTTKPIGVGTGLGLSICHGIVTALGGEITVESQLGQGTVFRVALPEAQVRISVPTPRFKGTEPPGRRGHILLVEDDALMRQMLARILKDHDVTTLTDAREAPARIAAGARFDLILCELVMPGMSGMELHDALSRTAPEQAERMIFVSDGAFTPLARAFLDRVPNERLEKPFDPKNLRAIVQRFLR